MEREVTGGQEVLTPRIGAEQVRQAAEVLRKYRLGKQNLDRRIIDNEQFWKLRHWEQMEKGGEGGNPQDVRPASGWLVNCILAKHADAMDSYPEPTVLPREPGDRKEAEVLTRILPVILKNNKFKKAYSQAWWNQLKSGCAVYGVFWDGGKLHGLGDIDIRSMDVLNLFWEPGVQSIQESEHFFSTELTPNRREGQKDAKQRAWLTEALRKTVAMLDKVQGSRLAEALERELADGEAAGNTGKVTARKSSAVERQRAKTQQAVRPR